MRASRQPASPPLSTAIAQESDEQSAFVSVLVFVCLGSIRAVRWNKIAAGRAVDVNTLDYLATETAALEWAWKPYVASCRMHEREDVYFAEV